MIKIGDTEEKTGKTYTLFLFKQASGGVTVRASVNGGSSQDLFEFWESQGKLRAHPFGSIEANNFRVDEKGKMAIDLCSV